MHFDVPVRITKPNSDEHWQSIREICCLTGNDGRSIELTRWPFFSEHWIGPYERLLPSWTYIAICEQKIIGYLTGCPNTKVFEKRKNKEFYGKLFKDVALGRYGKTKDTRSFLAKMLLLTKGVENRFPKDVSRELLEKYPAHLHINLLKEYRGYRIGQKLMAAFFEDLAAQGVQGTHVYCGPKPVRFYEGAGFSSLGIVRSEAQPVHALGRVTS